MKFWDFFGDIMPFVLSIGGLIILGLGIAFMNQDYISLGVLMFGFFMLLVIAGFIDERNAKRHGQILGT